MAEELLTVPEVADMLRLNEQTVRRWLRDGTLPGFRLGHNRKAGWRIPRTDVERYIEAQRGEGAAA